jgi:hypothetical protein
MYADYEQGYLASTVLGPLVLNMRKWAIGLFETHFCFTTRYNVFEQDIK